MSGVRRYDELLPDVLLATNAEDFLILRELRNAGRQFCKRSTLWREDLPSIDIRTPVTTWTCDSAVSKTGHFDAEADTNIIGVGSAITIASVAYTISAMTSNGDQTGEVTLSTLPTGSVAGTESDIDKITKTNGWQVIDDHEFVLDERANAVIDRLVRLRMILTTGGTSYYDYYEDDGVYRFVPPDTVILSSLVSVDTAIADALTFRAILVPDPKANEVPSWILNEWGEAISAWAIHRILAMPGPTQDVKNAGYWLNQYNEKLSEALMKADEAWGFGR